MKTRTRFRPLDGILLLDKPSGISSNQALQRARHLFRAEKGGHTGSLDPLATGMLPLCFGEATKIAGLLLGSRKAYETVARLGITTDTDDADGQVLRERPVPVLSAAAMEAALQPLRGSIRQRAPIYSALKQGGERLYALARKGLPVEAPVREVEVTEIRVIEQDGDVVRLHVECGSGTYVRALVRDLGESLGCGAHVLELRRLWVDPFRSPAMVTLDVLHAEVQAGADEPLLARLLPLSAGLSGFPSTSLGSEDACRFRQGQAVGLLEDPGHSVGDDADLVVVSGPDAVLLGLARAEAGRLHPRRLFNLHVTA